MTTQSFPSLVICLSLSSSGLSWWRSYQNWGSFMTQTLWSSWPGLGTHTHKFRAHIILIWIWLACFCRSSLMFAWLVSMCACVHTCVSALVCGGVCLMSDESRWASMNKTWGCWKGPSCWQSSNPPRGPSVAGLSIKSVSLMGSEVEPRFGKAPYSCCCVFAHLFVSEHFFGHEVGFKVLCWQWVVHIISTQPRYLANDTSYSVLSL